MASIIAGRGTVSTISIPYVGPAAGATLMPVKVLDANSRGTEFWLEEGIRYAVSNHAHVINLSLNFARNYVPGAALRDAIAAARDAKVVVVGASGNTGDGRVLYPAAFPDVISVGAFRLDAAAGYAMTSYSNWGDALDLAAPGGMPGQDVNNDGPWDGGAALRADGRAAGAVMIADANGNPVGNVEVHARWRGAASGAQTATTDWSGIARFVSPAPTSSRKLFVIEVPRFIYRGAAQRPRPFAHSGSGFNTAVLTVSLSTGGVASSVDGLGIWGYGYSQDSGLASGTTGSGLASGTSGSGLGSGTTGSTGSGSAASYPLTTGINACLQPLQLHAYGPFSWQAASTHFSGAPPALGHNARTVDSSSVLTPGAAALDTAELGNLLRGRL